MRKHGQTAEDAREYEFYNPRTDTLVQVEQTHDRIVIRTTRDTYSDAQRQAFLRELEAEGFIAPLATASSVQWIIDCSWLTISAAVRRPGRRLMVTLLIVTPLAWVVLMLLATLGILSSPQ